MYTSTHTTAGLAITTTSVVLLGELNGIIVGGLLSFISHFLVDYIGEKEYKGREADESGYNIFYCVAAMLVSPIIFGVAMVFANLPDIIDKRRLWLKKLGVKLKPYKEWFSCHNGKGLLSIGRFKLGYPVVVKLTAKGTENIFHICLLIFVLNSIAFYLFVR